MSNKDILAEAIRLLGLPASIQAHRNWAVFWCPFHDDAARSGKRGRPNFGVNLQDGHWKCLRCGASGPSLEALARDLGRGVRRQPPPTVPRLASQTRPRFALLGEAMAATRMAFRGSPAERYLAQVRGIRPAIASMYGVGYGVAYPAVGEVTLQAARAWRMATDNGWWLWADGVVYAEPPLEPQWIQVRHSEERRRQARRRGRRLPKYQTWGRLAAQGATPGGAWRITASTQALVVVEGLVDMLALAQVFHDRGLGNRVVPVYLAGGGSAAMYAWLREKAARYQVFLVPDPDEGGKDWVANLKRHRVQAARVLWPPEGRDPDEAVLAGWWPFPF